MNELDRRSLLKAITAVPFAYCETLSVPNQEPVSVVASHTDRTGHPHKAARANSHLDFKVLTRETDGRVFIITDAAVQLPDTTAQTHSKPPTLRVIKATIPTIYRMDSYSAATSTRSSICG